MMSIVEFIAIVSLLAISTAVLIINIAAIEDQLDDIENELRRLTDDIEDELRRLRDYGNKN